MNIQELYHIYQQHPCITTDSRDCPEGSIFLALKGEKFNGNHYALQALEKGCAYAIVDEDIATNTIPNTLNSKLIRVDDCLQTYKDLAREHRRQFHIPVIGITGTNGKTTTKELVKAVLSEKYNVLATEGNFNNDVGVPKTLFRLNKGHEIAIIEMGASHPGDIKTLAETAEPTCGIITNVGRAHLQGFGSFEGVIKTKGELYDFLRSREDGLVFLNADNDYLCDLLSDDDRLWVTPYSTDPEKQYECISGEVIEASPYLKFRWRKPLMELERRQERLRVGEQGSGMGDGTSGMETGASTKWHKVQTHLVGAYNIDNLLAAIAVGINFNVDRKQICHALENYVPTNNRSQLVQTEHNRLIVDAYNANPSSMAAALQNFRLIEAPRKMVILGDMRELGEASQEEHQAVVDELSEMDLTEVWLVGEEFGKTQCPYRRFANVDEVKKVLETECPEDYTILVKGSNGIKLYQLPELL